MINSATRWPRIRGLFDVTGLPTSAVLSTAAVLGSRALERGLRDSKGCASGKTRNAETLSSIVAGSDRSKGPTEMFPLRL